MALIHVMSASWALSMQCRTRRPYLLSVGLVDLFSECRSPGPYKPSVVLVGCMTRELIMRSVGLVGFLSLVSNSWAV